MTRELRELLDRCDRYLKREMRPGRDIDMRALNHLGLVAECRRMLQNLNDEIDANWEHFQRNEPKVLYPLITCEFCYLQILGPKPDEWVIVHPNGKMACPHCIRRRGIRLLRPGLIGYGAFATGPDPRL